MYKPEGNKTKQNQTASISRCVHAHVRVCVHVSVSLLFVKACRETEQKKRKTQGERSLRKRSSEKNKTKLRNSS